MGLKTIVIDNKTKATKQGDMIKVDLVVYPMDENNDFEPNQELCIYINDQLLGTLISDIDGKVNQEIGIADVDKNTDGISIKVSDMVSIIQSKVKYILIEDNIIAEEPIKGDVKQEFSLEKKRMIAMAQTNPNELLGDLIKKPNSEWANDQDIIELASRLVKRNWFPHQNLFVRENKNFVRQALQENIFYINHVAPLLLTDVEFMTELIIQYGIFVLHKIPMSLLDSESIRGALSGIGSSDKINFYLNVINNGSNKLTNDVLRYVLINNLLLGRGYGAPFVYGDENIILLKGLIYNGKYKETILDIYNKYSNIDSIFTSLLYTEVHNLLSK